MSVHQRFAVTDLIIYTTVGMQFKKKISNVKTPWKCNSCVNV